MQMVLQEDKVAKLSRLSTQLASLARKQKGLMSRKGLRLKAATKTAAAICSLTTQLQGGILGTNEWHAFTSRVVLHRVAQR